jgi:hypothetical protein
VTAGRQHVTLELLGAVAGPGEAGGPFLRLVAHLRRLCPVCDRAVVEYFAAAEGSRPAGWAAKPLPPSVDPRRRDATRPVREREAALAATLLARMDSPARHAALAAGLLAPGLALVQAWMERTGEAMGDDHGEGERRARFAVALVERLDPQRLPGCLVIDLQVDGWLALAHDALCRGLPERGAAHLRIAGLLAEGGSGDAQQAGYREMLHGLLACQQGELERGVRRLGRAAEMGREVGADSLTGASLLLQGQALELLGQPQAAAASLAEGLGMVPAEAAPDLHASAAAALRRLPGGAPDDDDTAVETLAALEVVH